MGNKCTCCFGGYKRFFNNNNKKEYKFRILRDKYTNLDQLYQAIRESGLEGCNLIFGIDYTQSNEWQGVKTFGGKSLHHIQFGSPNPYQHVIHILGETMERFDEDKWIPAYGFGDLVTKDKYVFSLKYDEKGNDISCCGFSEVIQRYIEITPTKQLSGPTSFAPIIDKAVNIVAEKMQYHILIIIADGMINKTHETTESIIRASNFPLSIIVIGVGDGPWDEMEEYDDGLPQRNFDNFQFVNFNKIVQECKIKRKQENDFYTFFAICALQEIPEQYHAIQKLGLMEKQQQLKNHNNNNISNKSSSMIIPSAPPPPFSPFYDDVK